MFHDRLRSARIYRGYTLQKTADSIGIPLRALQKYESGEIEPNLKMLTQFADLFDVPADFLLGRDDYLRSLGVSVDVPQEGPPRRPKPQKSRQSPHIQSSDSGEV